MANSHKPWSNYSHNIDTCTDNLERINFRKDHIYTIKWKYQQILGHNWKKDTYKR